LPDRLGDLAEDDRALVAGHDVSNAETQVLAEAARLAQELGHGGAARLPADPGQHAPLPRHLETDVIAEQRVDVVSHRASAQRGEEALRDPAVLSVTHDPLPPWA